MIGGTATDWAKIGTGAAFGAVYAIGEAGTVTTGGATPGGAMRTGIVSCSPNSA